MAKHRRMSERSRRTRTVVGGLAAGGALAAFAPAGMAAAADVDEDGNPPKDTLVSPDSPAYSVGRDNLRNPAPGLRLAQTLGDQAFNDDTAATKALNGSPLGTAYHDAFGTRGTYVPVDTDGDKEPDALHYKVGSGTEGSFRGVLNTTPADELGNVLPVRECNIKRDPASGAPVFGVRSCN
jgi:hypothetical protein